MGESHYEDFRELVTIYKKSKRTLPYLRNKKRNKFILFSKETGYTKNNTKLMLPKDRNSFFLVSLCEPNSSDLNSLSNIFNIHNETIEDITCLNTREHIDYFKEYIFITFRQPSKYDYHIEIRHSIILFPNFIIIIQQGLVTKFLYQKSIILSLNDAADDEYIVNNRKAIYEEIEYMCDSMLNFMGKISEASTELALFSIITEITASIKSITEELRSDINILIEVQNRQILKESANRMKGIFDLEQKICSKIKIIRKIWKGANKKHYLRMFLGDTMEDLKEVKSHLEEYRTIFERIQDIIMAEENERNSYQSEKLNTIMRKITIITLMLLPLQTVAGLWGMNIHVPGDSSRSWKTFVSIIIGGIAFSLVCSLIVIMPFSRTLNKKYIS